tara:strand:+ start:1077 stop:1979 length:903 start_codon:yes stop_codon:yes gene_type:complete
MLKKIDFIHSLIFFNLCIILSSISFIKDQNFLIICLFLILSIGISHGSLDNLKGKKLLKIFKIKEIEKFYFSYICLSVSVILLWIIFPNFLLAIFLLVASYHFGKEDTVFKINIKGIKKDILFLFKGSSIIIAPLLFNYNETNQIFLVLKFDLFTKFSISKEIFLILLLLSFLSGLVLSKIKNIDDSTLTIMDFSSILIINYFLDPLLAFTIYFCFLHSIRHSLTLVFELDKNFELGLKKFIKKALPLTLITAGAYLISIYSLNHFFELNNAIYKVIFIGLASLTFPHILLEYLIEKNEK